MNKAFLIGHIGKDPEIINLESGATIAKFSIATNESYKDKQGNRVNQTEWHNITVFGKLADVVKNYFNKGSKVMVEGKIKTDSYEKEGQKRYSTSIIMSGFEFLDSKGGSNPSTTQQSSQAEDNDDLPF